ncbi:unnamed protein product [Urochloa decumbens]|uniref:KIB1-4 beta-propeller domain-containing protein n=1 Tax=Urochloa decumbens TaxID=240449 RepID=A0ABC9F6I8_9POAL
MWADLLPELFDLVVDRLDAISILRFPAACKSWAAACKDSPRRLRSGSPTLLSSGLDLEGIETEHDVNAGAFALHDVSSSSTTGGGRRSSFLGEAEGLKGRTWIGGKDDWLVTTDYHLNVELLNPVTGDRVPLPSFENTWGLVEVTMPGYLYVSVEDRLHRTRWHKMIKVTLCQTPAHPSGYLAVALFSYGLLAYTAAGDKSWTALKNKNDPAASRFDDACYYYMDTIVLKGKLFAVTGSGLMYSWDMKTSSSSGTTEAPPAVVVRSPEEIKFSDHYGQGFYLATSSAGQLLVIYVYGDINYSFGVKDNRVSSRLVLNERLSFDEYGMSIHELDAGSGAWRRVADIGEDRALFLGANYPFYINVPPGSEELIKTNCVYVADTPSGYDVGVFDLKKGKHGYVERLTYSLMADPLQMPMWFRPTTHPRLATER